MKYIYSLIIIISSLSFAEKIINNEADFSYKKVASRTTQINNDIQVSTITSPIKKSWGNLVTIQKLFNNHNNSIHVSDAEEWIFENESEITILHIKRTQNMFNQENTFDIFKKIIIKKIN
jgi:hypothetical protein